MHLFSNNSPIIAKISSLIMFEFFPARFSCSINFNLPQNSLVLSGRKMVLTPDTSIAF